MARIRLGTTASETDPPAGQVTIFAKNTDDNLYLRKSTGLEYVLLHSGMAGVGGYEVEQFELDLVDILNKEITLLDTPMTPQFVLLQVDGGAPAFYSLDFTVSGNVLSWNGLRLDGLLEVGDRVQVIYY
jgi:hypothetical protein